MGELQRFCRAIAVSMNMRITLDGETFDLTPELVRARLERHVPEDTRSYWVDIDGTRWPVKQVISLATGVNDRQRFQSQSSRRWLQNLGFAIGKDSVIITKLEKKPSRSRTSPTTRLHPTVPMRTADIVLIGCVKSKLDVPAEARDLYTSDYFLKMRRYAEASNAPWFILSAEHGLVAPTDWLEPYERYLPDTSREYRSDWGQRVGEQLELLAGPLAGKLIEIHAGAAYVEAVEHAIQARGAEVRDPLQGLSIGHRLAWYLRDQQDEGIPVVFRLRDEGRAMTLAALIDRGGEGLKSPGMYSWWVDDAGAADLSTGLGHAVRPGLIYAGLAGATRAGGSASSNTLWGRIATMHLGKKHEFSTLRRSLGSILAEANKRPFIDEAELTRWMHAHLKVVPIPVQEADTLDQLETALLMELDPPLNLAKVGRTPLRQRLSALRKQYGGIKAGLDIAAPTPPDPPGDHRE